MKTNGITLAGGVLKNLSIPTKSSVQDVQLNQLAVDGIELVKRGSSSWVPQVPLGELPLYAFSNHTFTTNKIIQVVPTLAELRSLYAGAPFVNDTALFNTSGAIQIWAVPATATYRIETVSPAYDQYQPGAKVTLDVALTKGTVLRMLCGQRSNGGPDAGGASFCQIQGGALLAVAGGYGGIHKPNASPPAAAPKIDLANPGSGNGGTSWAASVGVQGSAAAAGGSGWNSACSYAVNGSASTIVGTALSVGGTPGQGHSPSYSGSRAYGGLGGGGGGGIGGNNQFRLLGGGGGYTGGNALLLTFNNNTAGYGGTCYAAPAGAAISNRASSLQTTSYMGYVKITKLA